jgi:hypothetical protein
MVSNRRSTFGRSCPQCNNDLIAPEWSERRKSEHRNRQHIRHLWRCWKCDFYFETIIDGKSMKSITSRDDGFPPRLVA